MNAIVTREIIGQKISPMTYDQHNIQAWLPPVYISLLLFIISVSMNFSTEIGDFREFRSWLIHIAEVGPVQALGHPFSGYSPPYIYMLAIVSPMVGWVTPTALIKLVSYIGYAMLALSVRHLLKAAGHRCTDRATGVFMLVPSLFANFAIMNQCDAFWAAGVVMATAAAIRRAHALMFIWFGLAIAFKLQAAFAGPFILAIAIAQGAPVRLWLLAPAATILAYLPAWLAGWPVMDLLFVYFRQVGFFHDLAMGAPNIWMIVQWIYPDPSLQWLARPGTLLAIVVCAGFIPWSQRYLNNAGPETILRIALIGALLAPSLLPRMHERYFFMADVLALVLGLLNIRRNWQITFSVQMGTTLAMLCYLTQQSIWGVLGAVSMLVAIWLTVRLPIAVEEYSIDRHPQSSVLWPTSSASPAMPG